MQELYGQQHRALQKRFETERLADAVKGNIVDRVIQEHHRAFIESRDFFYLSSIDHRGFPTCSYKGGAKGFLRVLDSSHIAFPSYDGNGMFLSMGNITANPKVGILCIDYEVPHRVRIHGEASIDFEDPLIASFAGADLVVRVRVEDIFYNCPRYIHRFKRVADSEYVPQANCEHKLAVWKRIDNLQEVLPPRDKKIAETLGGTITSEEYVELVNKGEA